MFFGVKWVKPVLIQTKNRKQTSRANVYDLDRLCLLHILPEAFRSNVNKMHDEGKTRAEFNIRDVHIIQGHRIRPRTK